MKVAATPDNTPKKRGFFARLFSGRADMGEKYNVRITVTKIFGKENRGYLRWLWDASAGYRWQILAITVFTAALSVVGVRLALVSKAMLDAVQVQNMDGFVRSAVILVAVTLAVRAGNLASAYFTERVRQSLLVRLREKVLHKLFTKDYGEIGRISTQDLINRLMNDTASAVGTIVGFPVQVVQLATTLVAAIGVLIELEPIFILIAVISVVPGLLMQRFSMPIAREFAQVERAIGIRINAFLQENIMQMSVVRAFGTADAAEEQADGVFSSMKDFIIDKTVWNNQVEALRMLYGIVTGTGMTVWCAYNILIGRMTFGSMGALITLFNQVRTPIKDLFSIFPQLMAVFVFVERLSSIDAMRDQVGEIMGEAEARAFYENEFEALGLRDVWFSYPSVAKDSVETADDEDADPAREPVLKGFSFTVRKGEIVAITGASGFGKSTLIKLIMGLYDPDSGERFVRTHAGDEALTSRHQRLFAYVPQGNRLMRGTIREVVSLGMGEKAAADDAVWKALEIACADDFVRELSGGLDANLGELGAGLSEGQAQRISIARAVMSAHPILVLDESTSALDAATEQRLLTNLRDLSGRTVIIVTHRQSVVDICDQNLHLGAEEL